MEEIPAIHYSGLGNTHSMGTLTFGFSYPNVDNVHNLGNATPRHMLVFDTAIISEGACPPANLTEFLSMPGGKSWRTPLASSTSKT